MGLLSIEPESYEGINKYSESMSEYIINNVKNGDIILLHPMNNKTDKIVNAIKSTVPELKSKGYSFKVLA